MSAPYPPHRPGPPPPSIDPKTLRPRRRWFAVGAMVIALGVLLGVAGLGVSMYRALSLPDFAAEVIGSNSETFTVDADFDTLGLYTSPGGTASDCAVTGPGGATEEFGSAAYSHTVEVNSQSWSLTGTLEPSEEGAYTLTCEGEEDVRYAAGDIGDGGREFMGNVVGGLASIFGLPLLGFAVGLPVIIVTAVKRNRHKQQLLAARHW